MGTAKVIMTKATRKRKIKSNNNNSTIRYLDRTIEMKFIETDIEGLIIIEPTIFEDPRGYFFESYNREKYVQAGLKVEFVQDNLSMSQKNVLRGLHFQAPPFAQGKLVQVLSGSVLDVAVDIRKNSPTYGKHQSLVLSAENKKQFFVPAGFAHGFLTLEDNTLFSYKCTNVYDKESEGAVSWNDPLLNIDWKTTNPLVSEKDKLADGFDNLESPF